MHKILHLHYEHHDSLNPHQESKYSLAHKLLPTEQEKLHMEESFRVLEGSHQQCAPPQGQPVSQSQTAAQLQVRKANLPPERLLEEDKRSLALSMDLDEAAVREPHARAEI